VFFGELTKGQLTDLELEIETRLEADDSVVVFQSQNPASFEYQTFGDADEPGSRFT
jgi:CRISPR-associated protein Cas2